MPMSPISDIGAFRAGRWQLEWFLEAIRRGLAWAIENRAVYDFLGHPSCLYVTDPQFRAVDLICEMVAAARRACRSRRSGDDRQAYSGAGRENPANMRGSDRRSHPRTTAAAP